MHGNVSFAIHSIVIGEVSASIVRRRKPLVKGYDMSKDEMRYNIELIFSSKPEENLKHSTNSWDQAEHFFWAIVAKLAKDKPIEIYTLTFYLNSYKDIKYQFSRTDK